MKKYFYFLLTGMILFLLGCENGSEPETAKADSFAIHLQQTFKNDLVTVKLDRTKIFEKSITTDKVLSLASIVEAEVYKGKHLVEITVNNNFTGSYTVEVGDTLNVCVNYSPLQGKFSFYSSTANIPYR